MCHAVLFGEMRTMRRELWRTERRESRHTLRLELLGERIPADDRAATPEDHLMHKCESKALFIALKALSSTQLRRLLMHAVAQLPVREIAWREGCSERAVKYGLARARKRMKEILPEGFPS